MMGRWWEELEQVEHRNVASDILYTTCLKLKISLKSDMWGKAMESEL